MAWFKYRALAPNGEFTEGEMDASNRDDVISRLRSSDHFPVMVVVVEPDRPQASDAAAVTSRPRTGARGSSRTARAFSGRRVSGAAVTTFTRELQMLLETEMPADRALEAIAAAVANEPIAEVVTDLRARLRDGATLSQAMAAHSQVFDTYYTTMVHAGERGSALADALGRLAGYLERTGQLVSSIRSALIYPTILVLAALVSLVILMAFVVPQFELLFRESASELPLGTRIVLGASAFTRDYGWIFAIALLALWLALRRRWMELAVQAPRDGALLRLPLAGPLIARMQVECFARSLATLLANGVSLTAALDLAGSTVRNSVFARTIAEAAEGVKHGERLADALDAGGVFPPLAIQLIRVGEEGGHLERMLGKLAEMYALEIDASLKRLVMLVEPALIVLIGFFVAFVVISLLSAIYGFNALGI